MLELRLSTHDVLPSSNNVVKHAIEAGEPQGLVVRTFKQTAGYGRLGRSWVSPEGGLYVSILLRPQVDLRTLPTLGLVVGLALQRTVEGILPAELRSCLRVKWPNDLVWKGGDRQRGVFPKVSGISFERHAGGVCVGVGVNVFRPFGEQAVGGKNVPVYLAEVLEQRLQAAGVPAAVGPEGLVDEQRALILGLCDRFLEELAVVYDQWQEKGMAAFVDEYSRKLCLMDERVMVMDQLDQSVVSGMVQGVDADGRLLLLTDAGVVEPVSSGVVQLA
ncbi:MAG: biotin--[acetyl-CoA-carboxylase] ligase [Coriobacteriia bacterium]|nr:biotin--[acetyl-CoA-carboxylase] ligase [Coriobacteriia bacterium]